MPPLPLPVSPRGTGGDWRTYGNALISVHPSRQFLSRSIPEAELAVSEGVFPYTRFWTSDAPLYVRLWLLADIQPHPELRPLYPRKRTSRWVPYYVCF